MARSKYPVRLNYVANRGFPIVRLTAWQAPACSIYAQGNRDIEIAGGIRTNRPFSAPAVRTHDADDLWDVVLDSAGATLPERDAVDRRIVAEVRAGERRLIDTPSDVGGWPKLRAVPAPTDTDADGMPDAWEREYGLEPEKADGTEDRDDDGYTNVEEYLNHTDPTKREPG